MKRPKGAPTPGRRTILQTRIDRAEEELRRWREPNGRYAKMVADGMLTEADRQRAISTIEAHSRQLSAVLLIAETATDPRVRNLVDAVMPAQGRGRPRGSNDPVRDSRLRFHYQRAAEDDPEAAERGALPRLLADRLWHERDKLGIRAKSAEGLEKRIRAITKRLGI